MSEQNCANCKSAEPGTMLSAEVIDWTCKWRPGKRLTKQSLPCLQWKPAKGGAVDNAGNKVSRKTN